MSDDLMRLLQQGRSKEDAPPPPRPMPEAQIMMLREIYGRYRAVPFKPGDLVTIATGCAASNVDTQPHIVLEVRPDAEPDFTQSNHVDPTCQCYGARYNVRIAVLIGSSYAAFWAESWYLEPYVEAA